MKAKATKNKPTTHARKSQPADKSPSKALKVKDLRDNDLEQISGGFGYDLVGNKKV